MPPSAVAPGPRSAAARIVLLALGCALTLPGPARSQSTLVVEARGGVSVPTGSFRTGPGGGRLAQAPALDLHFGLLRGSRTYVYVGFAQARIGCSGDGCGSRWVSTQWDAGVRVELARGGVVPWIRAGVVTPTVENVPLGAPAPEPTGTSERGWGGEAGAGVRFALSERLSVSPGARYVAVDVGRAGSEDLRMRYVVLDLGLVVGF